MKRTTTKKPFDHSGSSFDSFLEEEGIREEAETVAIKTGTRLAAGAGDAGAAQDEAGHGKGAPHQPLAT